METASSLSPCDEIFMDMEMYIYSECMRCFPVEIQLLMESNMASQNNLVRMKARKFESLDRFIDSHATWCDTPQGDNYWEELYDTVFYRESSYEKRRKELGITELRKKTFGEKVVEMEV